jgi:hypothetical protein
MRLKIILILMFAALFAFAVMCFLYARTSRTLEEDILNSDRRVLVDSIKLEDKATLFWIYYLDASNDQGMAYISIGKNLCEVSKSNALISCESIYELERGQKDTIFITTYNGYSILKQYPGVVFRNKVVKGGRNFKRNSIEHEILLSEICK